MSEAELIQLNKDHNCTLYTIQFITEDKGEYLRFYNRFKDDAIYNEDDELRGFVVTLQNFDKLIKEGVKEGTIAIFENEIETDKTFDI